MSFKDLDIPEPPSQSTKISLDLKTFAAPTPKPTPQPVIKEVVSPPTIVPEPEVKTVEKKIIKEQPLESKKKIPQVVQKTEELNTTKVVKQKPKESPKQQVKKVAMKKPAQKTRPSKDPLANMLMKAGSSISPRSNAKSFAEEMVSRVYGKEFHSYSKEQKRFIKQKLGEIYRITQNTLWQKGYPDVALRMQMQGTNIVSFYLHPNGDISNLRLKSHIGYKALDENTLEVIKTAYKDYPKPKKRTKIMFFVKYKLY